MEVRILGPLEVATASRLLPLGGPRQQVVLSVLALEPNRVVSVDRLVDAVWGETPPLTARRQIRICVSALRRCFAVADGPTITTQAPGYMEAVIIGLMGSLVGWFTSHEFVRGAMTIGLPSGLGFLLVLGVPRWFEYPTTTTTAISPRSTWQADRNLTLIRILIGIVVGLMAGIIGLQARLSLTTALVGGLLLGLLFGLIVGRHHAWPAYSLSVLRLASKGALPLRAMGFLEDAHRLGVLRTEGPFYQFRNIELQKHLSSEQRFSSMDQP